MEYNMQHAISALRSAALNEDRDKDDPLSIFMKTMDASGMFRTLLLTLATVEIWVLDLEKTIFIFDQG